MDKRIIIVHRSEIIRKGLINILRTSFQNDIIEISSTGELQDYLNISDRLIIILVEAQQATPEFMRYAGHLKERNRVRILGVTADRIPDPVSPPVMDLIDTEISAGEFLDRIRSLLQDGSGIPTSTPLQSLTNRETGVLKLVALGLLNKEIADKLSISIHTVISHRKNITMKLGIKSISGLTVYAVINRLIDLDQFDPDKIL